MDAGTAFVGSSHWRHSPLLHSPPRRALVSFFRNGSDGPHRSACDSTAIREVPIFIFISHLSVPEADRDALERHFRDRSGLVDGFPGFLYLQLLRPESGSASHTFLTAWEDRAAFRRYMRSREHAVSHGREPAQIMARTSVRHEAFEVVMDSRNDPEWMKTA